MTRHTSLRPREGGKFHAPVVGIPKPRTKFPWGDALRITEEAERLVGRECTITPCPSVVALWTGNIGVVKRVRFDRVLGQEFLLATNEDGIDFIASSLEPVSAFTRGDMTVICGKTSAKRRSASSALQTMDAVRLAFKHVHHGEFFVTRAKSTTGWTIETLWTKMGPDSALSAAYTLSDFADDMMVIVVAKGREGEKEIE